MAGNVARITTLMFVVTHVMEIRRTNAHLRYKLFYKTLDASGPYFLSTLKLSAALCPSSLRYILILPSQLRPTFKMTVPFVFFDQIIYSSLMRKTSEDN
jgi:hypothetical protein